MTGGVTEDVSQSGAQGRGRTSRVEKMTSQLSDRDFQRLQVNTDILYFVPGLNWKFQESLLELKTQNYTLEDQARKQRHALGEVSTAILTITY